MINKCKSIKKRPGEQTTKVSYFHRQQQTKARDIKIAELILLNFPDKAIAAELNITQSTLDFHKRNLYQRVNVFSKTELIIKLLKKTIVL